MTNELNYKYFKKKRIEKGNTCEEIARKLNLELSDYNSFERGEKNLERWILLRLFFIFNLKPN